MLALRVLAVLLGLASAVFGADPAVGEEKLAKTSEIFAKDVVEATPLLYQGRTLLFCSRRPFGDHAKVRNQLYLYVRGIEDKTELTRFGEYHSLGSAFVNGDEINVFASEASEKDWFQDIYRFSTTDLKTWKRELAIPRADGEHLLNSSVCRDEQGYLMAYESDRPVSFCFKFARSKDLAKWEKIPGLAFAGIGGREYSACPMIRYFKLYYYVIYLRAGVAGHNGWVSFLARSKDLATWQLSPKNPVLEAGKDEGNNNSDVDMIEIDGKTYVYYCTGNQATWGDLKRAVYPGTMLEYFESCFPEGATMTEVSAKTK